MKKEKRALLTCTKMSPCSEINIVTFKCYKNLS